MDLLPPQAILTVWLGTAVVWLVVLVAGLAWRAVQRQRERKP